MAPSGHERLSAEGLDRLVEQARRMVDAVQANGSVRGDESPLQGEGMAAEGRVRATVLAGGRLSSLTIDPRAMRADAESLGEEIMAAVNAAVDDLLAKATERAGAPADAGEIASALATLQQESVREMAKFTQAINDVVMRFERRV